MNGRLFRFFINSYFVKKKCMLVAMNKHLQLVVLSLFHKICRQTNFSTVKPVLSGHPRGML